ncbi:hypothetical protein PCO80_19650 [Pectobacteriaceae bacterium C80]|nr:hypothetical protein PCO80_19650 [Pectobacteriaceae bacterium C80]
MTETKRLPWMSSQIARSSYLQCIAFLLIVAKLGGLLNRLEQICLALSAQQIEE